MGKLSKIIRCVTFVLLASLMLLYLSNVLQRKTVSGAWNYMTKLEAFYRREQNSVDMLGVGSSHMYCTLNPVEAYHSEQIRCQLLATRQQPLAASYHFILEALKTQQPKVVVLECYTVLSDEKTVYTPNEVQAWEAIAALRKNRNRFELTMDMIAPSERMSYFLPFIQFHDRWDSLTELDYHPFKTAEDAYHGFIFLNKANPTEPILPTDYALVESKQLDSAVIAQLDRIVQLSKDANFELLFLLAPYHAEQVEVQRVQALTAYCEQNGIPFLNLMDNCDVLGVDFETEFYDDRHLNVQGAAKASRYLARYLTEHFALSPSLADSARWEQDYQTYLHDLEKE